MIPKDPMILLSFVNTKLRDEYKDLEALCDGLDISGPELLEKMAIAGYFYDPDLNRFVSE